MSLLVPPTSERIIAARRAFFERGHEDGNLIDPAIYRSWSRCIAASREETEAVEFEQVSRTHINGLVQRNRMLMEAGLEAITDLEKAVAGAGYAVLLTDNHGHAISIGGALDQQHPSIRQALRLGVDLSEATIGTSAMSCAISEQRPVRVFGPEHFFSANRQFHCAAAPIVDPRGGLVGTVDITRGSSDADLGALSLVTHCAQAIEHELFRRIPARAIFTLSWQPNSTDPTSNMSIAFGDDAEVLATNDATRRFLGLDARCAGLFFEDIFAGRFGQTLSLLKSARQATPIQLRSGIQMFASLWPQDSHRSPGSTAARPGVSGAALPRMPQHDGARRPRDNPAPTTIQSFGDERINGDLKLALKALASGLPILLLGETGTGKDVLSKLLHENSARGHAPYIAINCASIPESLIESELFGYDDGAFTGARRGGAPGKIEQAHGGTLFLDEIGDMPQHLQARLLRVLENKEVSRLGGSTLRKVDFQLICATHHPIEPAVQEGRFRRDLYYRINGFELEVPALRERMDIQSLATSILADISCGTRRFSDAALDLIVRHDWPGNVRELRNAITYAHAIAPEHEALGHEHLPKSVRTAANHKPSTEADKVTAPQGALLSMERNAIQKALGECGGNVSLAARSLGISKATIYRRIKSGEVKASSPSRGEAPAK